MTEPSFPNQREGGCLCGRVRYRVTGPLRPVVMCHCTQCRRTTGHVMAATAARRTDFHLVKQDDLRWFDSSTQARRGFCGRCGSTLFWDGAGREHISIAAGTLDDSRGLRIACHIFTANKGDYYLIDGDVPQSTDGQFSVAIPTG
jgi:hypothetical protein